MAAAARVGLPPAEDDPLEEGESEEEVESGEEGGDDGSEAANLAYLDAGSDEDPSFDPAADEGEAALWSGMARLSISARKARLFLCSEILRLLEIRIPYEFREFQERICGAGDGKGGQ